MSDGPTHPRGDRLPPVRRGGVSPWPRSRGKVVPSARGRSRPTGLRLEPLDDRAIELAATWLGEEENYKWLDFGHGKQRIGALALKLMSQRDIHLLRAFTEGSGSQPIGVVALSDIARAFGTATLWYVLGEKAYARHGYTTEAVYLLLDVGFRELGLRSVQAWTVEANRASVRVLERNGFSLAGRLRQCHVVDGIPQDRLLFDLLAEEYLGSLGR